MRQIGEANSEIKLGNRGNLTLFLVLPLVLFFLAFLLDTPRNIFRGLYYIIIAPDTLLTDYIAIGGIGATFINVSILALINICFIYKLKLDINGVIIAAFFTLIGFSFLGKNIFNIWPIYLGGYLYSKHQKIEFKSIVITIMFSTALAPVVSELAFGLHVPLLIGLPSGIIFGILSGFVITPLSYNMFKIHDGYNLYNIGFTAGILGTILTSFLRGFGLIIEPKQILSTEYDLFLKIFFTGFFIFFILLGYILNKRSFKGYTQILKISGRLVSDYTQLVGYGVTYINMGVMGLISIIYIMALGGVFNGPVVGAMLTVFGFSALGKHPKNALPIMAGVFIGGILKIWDINSTLVIIAGLFGTTLAPVAGEFGTIVGLMAGFLHLSVVMNVSVIHGGLNLYNNGFSGGFVAATLVPMISVFKKQKS